MAVRVQALSIVDAVAGDLRNKLFTGDLAGNAQLTEAEVAVEYEVARPTAKAAIEKLVGEGLLVRGTHRTARVLSLTHDDVHDLYHARRIIESEVVRELAVRGVVPVAVSSANPDVLAVAGMDEALVIEPVMRFHVSLVAAVGSPRLSRLFDTMVGEMRLCMIQMQSQKTLEGGVIVDEHKLILDAIVAGDPDAAATALYEHLSRAEQRTLRPEGPRTTITPGQQ